VAHLLNEQISRGCRWAAAQGLRSSVVGVVHANKELPRLMLRELFGQRCLSMVGTTLATTSLVIIVGAVMQTSRQVRRSMWHTC
jgi:hypothetical protein